MITEKDFVVSYNFSNNNCVYFRVFPLNDRVREQLISFFELNYKTNIQNEKWYNSDYGYHIQISPPFEDYTYFVCYKNLKDLDK